MYRDLCDGFASCRKPGSIRRPDGMNPGRRKRFTSVSTTPGRYKGATIVFSIESRILDDSRSIGLRFCAFDAPAGAGGSVARVMARRGPR